MLVGFSSRRVNGVFYAADVNGEPFNSAIFDSDSIEFEAFSNEVEANVSMTSFRKCLQL